MFLVKEEIAFSYYHDVHFAWLKSDRYNAACITNSAIECMQLIVEKVIVPLSFHGKAIRKKGKAIKDLEKEFPCEIFVPKGGGSDQIELKGMSAERFKDLKDRIDSLINKYNKRCK